MAAHVPQSVAALGVCNLSARMVGTTIVPTGQSVTNPLSTSYPSCWTSAAFTPSPDLLSYRTSVILCCLPGRGSVLRCTTTILSPSEARALCKSEGVVFQAYASLGAGLLGLPSNPLVVQVAQERGVSPGQVSQPLAVYCSHRKSLLFMCFFLLLSLQIIHSFTQSPAQVLLRWGLQKGCCLLPKSSQEARQKENMDLWTFSLTKEDMEKLDSLNRSEPGQNTMVGWLREHDPDFYY